MEIEKEPRLLYSVGTKLSYQIDNWFYNRIHYVWCTDKFHSDRQAPTSDPRTIVNRFLKQIASGDRHQTEIEMNITGILRGAEVKLRDGIITEEQYKKIHAMAACADYRAFFPVLYIIYADRVKDRYTVVPSADRASDESVEYKILDLAEGEYELIEFEPMLYDIIHIVDKLAGE